MRQLILDSIDELTNTSFPSTFMIGWNQIVTIQFTSWTGGEPTGQFSDQMVE